MIVPIFNEVENIPLLYGQLDEVLRLQEFTQGVVESSDGPVRLGASDVLVVDGVLGGVEELVDARKRER